MAKKEQSSPDTTKVVAINRKARFEYSIEDTFEAGLVLQGTEVKSLRNGRANIQDAYAGPYQNEIWLYNAHIAEYTQGNRNNHPPLRPRKLLMHRRQVNKLLGLLKVKGTTLIPLKLYFNASGFAKLELGVARGKKQYEKRETIKNREWKKEQGRLLKK
jgi:SsrA-binding protein